MIVISQCHFIYLKCRFLINYITRILKSAPCLFFHMQVVSRHHIRRDSVRQLRSSILNHFGIQLPGKQHELVTFSDFEIDLVLIDGEPLACYINDVPSLTVKGANTTFPSKKLVIVNQGAIPFVSNGADIMKPGILESDSSIEPGDIVVIAEGTHNKALSIGKAIVPGVELLSSSGKAIESIHHVGDKLYHFS